MKTRFIEFTVLLLIFTVVFSSCKKPEPEPNYPIKISFEEYSLEGTQCQWTNLPYNDEVIVINSNNELKKYITYAEKNYPEIDFSKYSLLLASGKPNNGVLNIITTDLQQHSSDKYSLSIGITLSDTTANTTWFTALIVKKLNKGSKVGLSASFTEQEIVYPIDVPFREYSLEGTRCKWKNMGYPYINNVYMINNNEELENYILCNNDDYPAIDFSKYTLLLVYGYSVGQPAIVSETIFTKNGKDKYTLDLTVFKGLLTSPSVWFYAILTSRISSETMIELNLNFF